MMSILLHALFNPYSLMACVVLGIALAAIFFLGGAALFVKVIKDWRLWAAVLMGLFLIGYANVQARLEKAEGAVVYQQQGHEAAQDTTEVLTNRVRRQASRAQEEDRLRTAIQQAPDNDELDSLLDAIGREQGGVAAPTARPVPAPERMRDGPDGTIEP